MPTRPMFVSLLLFMTATSLHAATFVVNSLGGDDDANPGDGFCATSTGACTLRAAISEANTTTGALIKLPASTDGNPIVAGGPIYRPMTIEGRGMRQTVVSGQGSSTVFWIDRKSVV